MHRPILLKDVSLCFSNKICFENFSSQILPGSRIAIIGRNGSGKSSLLEILCQELLSPSGEAIIPNGMSTAYVEQTIDDFDQLSGGQRVNKKLSQALAQSPDLLLLDEPTNHLDSDNRKSLMQMLKRYQGTLIIVSHDTELLRNCIDTLWHIDHHQIHEFTGSYDDYIREVKQKRSSIERELAGLKRDKNMTHSALMREQKRAAKSRAKGQKSIEQRKWPTMVSHSKAHRAEQTSGKKKSAIDRKKQQLIEQIDELKLPEKISPQFSLNAENVSAGHLLSISGANIGYGEDRLILKNISLTQTGRERIAICGKNASGKSTLLKAILGRAEIYTSGSWCLPRIDDIGYLDQHYSDLRPELSVIDHVKELRSDWSEAEVRRFLARFLFRKSEEVMQSAACLSGGEKARLSLCMIAAKTPRLLVLDEVTNNLDLETKEHVIQVLREYPGSMIVVSHEEEFLQAIGIDSFYTVLDGNLNVKI
ncbi:MAG: ABC-F family ATP-binding cassette domain-containing protein [Chlamydiia bacterium]|nr:ABC-F family ATP-binding cassette domain-containing protein [Chlamydiia bacterium]